MTSHTAVVKKFRRSQLRHRVELFLASAVLAAGTTTLPARADRNDIVPLAGPIAFLQTPLTGVTAMLVDDANRRVYMSSTAQNTVIEFTFDGLLISVNNTLAAPEQMALINGTPYVTLRNTGQVVKLSPATLTPTVVAGGFTGIAGLAALNGKLYATTQTPTNYGRAIVEINPSTGASSVVPMTAPYIDVSLLFGFPGDNALYGTGTSGSPSGLHRIDPVAYTNVYEHDSPGSYARLPDGDILVGTQSLNALNPSTMKPSGRTWTGPAAYNANSLLDANNLSVLTVNGNALTLYDTKNTLQIQRRYQFSNVATISAVASTRDGSQLVAAVPSTQGTLDVYTLPGVRTGSPQSAPAAGTTRRPALGAGAGAGAGNITRGAATQTGGNRPFIMKDISDIEFGSDGIYTSDSTEHVIDVFNANAEPLTGWAGLGGVEAMTPANGAMCATLRLEGSIVCLGVNGPQRIARDIYRPSGLVTRNGLLWTSYVGTYNSFWMSVDPTSGVQWRQPVVYGEGFSNYASQIPEGPFNGLLIATKYYDTITTFNPATRVNGANFSAAMPMAVSPNGTFGVDQTGKRFNVATMTADGFIYPGTNPTLSGTNPSGIKYVAETLGNQIVIYNEDNPAQIIKSVNIPNGITVQRIEFRPNTNELWVAVYNSTLQLAYLVKGTVNNIALMVDSQTEVSVGTADTARLQIDFDPPKTDWETAPPLSTPLMEQPTSKPTAEPPTAANPGPADSAGTTSLPVSAATPVASPTETQIAPATSQVESSAPVPTPTSTAAETAPGMEVGPALAVEPATQETVPSSPTTQAPSPAQVSQAVPKPFTPTKQTVRSIPPGTGSVKAKQATKRRANAKPKQTRRQTRKQTYSQKGWLVQAR
jgi:hypothetical protein